MFVPFGPSHSWGCAPCWGLWATLLSSRESLEEALPKTCWTTGHEVPVLGWPCSSASLAWLWREGRISGIPSALHWGCHSSLREQSQTTLWSINGRGLSGESFQGKMKEKLFRIISISPVWQLEMAPLVPTCLSLLFLGQGRGDKGRTWQGQSPHGV